jgi:mono/diheme cytochrome c family protein
MRPDPPDLSETAKGRSVEQIFWIVKHGINMTAMPGFSRIGVEDQELWQIAAFVKRLPETTDVEYKAWTSAEP